MVKRSRAREGEMLEEPTIAEFRQDLDPTSTSKRKKARRGAERKQQLVNGVGSRAIETAQDELATATTDGESPSRIKDLPRERVAELMPGITALLESYHDLDTNRLAAFSGQLLSLAFEGWQKGPLSGDLCPVERDEPQVRNISGGQDGISKIHEVSTLQRQLENFRTELANMKFEQSRQQQKLHTITDSRSRETENNDTSTYQIRLDEFKTDLAQIKLEQGHQQQQQQLLSMALQSDTTSLRQEIDMTRVQREQQRHWNKNVLREQAEGFQREINLLTEQLKDQKAQQKDIQELRAEIAELKAGNLQGWSKSPGAMNGPAHPHDESNNVILAQTNDEAKEVKLIEKSITAREAQWKHFLSQKGNYMYAPNLENGLKDIVRDIRKFSIRHPHNGLVIFDLVLFAVNHLYRFTIEGKDGKQDFHSVPLKINAWREMDELAYSVLKGMGWRYLYAEITLDSLEERRKRFEVSMRHCMPELNWTLWLVLTTNGLRKCARHAVVG